MSRFVLLVCCLLLPVLPVMAQDTSQMMSGQAVSGVKETLARGVESAINQLGQEDGFLDDPAVRIGLPGQLNSIAETARKLGQGQYVDQLELTMNRAAEAAVPAAAEVFGDAIRQMSVRDAAGLLTGGKQSVTDYFRSSSGDALRERLLPIVAQATSASGTTAAYKSLMDKGGGALGGALGRLGGSKGGDAAQALDLDGYVTDKALDGLFHYIGVQEEAIRSNPVERGSRLLESLFGG